MCSICIDRVVGVHGLMGMSAEAGYAYIHIYASRDDAPRSRLSRPATARRAASAAVAVKRGMALAGWLAGCLSDCVGVWSVVVGIGVRCLSGGFGSPPLAVEANWRRSLAQHASGQSDVKSIGPVRWLIISGGTRGRSSTGRGLPPARGVRSRLGFPCVRTHRAYAIACCALWAGRPTYRSPDNYPTS